MESASAVTRCERSIIRWRLAFLSWRGVRMGVEGLDVF